MSDYSIRKKSGRAFNGSARDAGAVTHAVEDDGYPSWTAALCKTVPGYRGGGWQEPEKGGSVSCRRCIKAMNEQQPRGDENV